MRITEEGAYNIIVFPDERYDTLGGSPFCLADIWHDVLMQENSTWQYDIIDIQRVNGLIELRPLNNTYMVNERGKRLPLVVMDLEGRTY